MERRVFADGIEKLALNFGITDSGDKWERKVAFLYDQLRNFPDEVWIDGVNEMLYTLIRFPALSEILQCLIKKKNNMSCECEIVDYPDCQLCDNTGFVTTYKILLDEDKKEKSVTQYVFRCDCDRGKNLSKRIPMWDNMWRQKGHELSTVYDEND